MKNVIKKIFIVLVWMLIPVVTIFSQPAAPPPTGTNASLAGQHILTCPVGNGYWMLFLLALGYGAYKVWQAQRIVKEGDRKSVV